MRRKISLLALAIVCFAANLYAAGFEPGVAIRAVGKDGVEITGTITGYDGKSEIMCFDQTGHYFKIPMKDIRRISIVSGKTFVTAGGTKSQVRSFEMANGQKIEAALEQHGIVLIDQGIKGKRNLWVTDSRYQFVETVESGSTGGDGFMKVKLLDGRIISVPVRRDEVHSIIFEK